MTSEQPDLVPIAGDEASTLPGSLDRQRATFAWTTGGPDRRRGRPHELCALWERTVARSRSAVEKALVAGGLDIAMKAWPDGRAPSLRRTFVDLIEQCARHTGHGDLLRESVDGRRRGPAPPLTPRSPGPLVRAAPRH